MKIQILRDTETVRYAADELKKYVTLMDDSISVEILTDGEKADGAIKLGLLSDLALSDEGVTDAMIDDLIDVDIKSFVGYIAGSNDRSILMGVYKYLKYGGCRWVRPGDDGEYVPKKDMSSESFKFRKLADYPFRGQACEGAISVQHMIDTVMWLPKIDMNLFMLEQIVPYSYMSRWYKHDSNSKLPHDDIPYEEYCKGCIEVEKAVKKCGLQLHALGHGAITEPFGIRYMTDTTKHEVPDGVEDMFALVDGKRGIHGSPFYTQLCMSNEKAVDTVVNWLADYIKEKPYIDFLHFWLGDSTNNHCECEKCVKKPPSDWYVDMMNKLDAKLTEQGNDTKIIFIMYVDTLWPPRESRLNTPSRFIMTTACGSGRGYSAKRREGGIPEWRRNDFAIEGGLDMALCFVDGWKPIFDGPKFVYEYWLYTRHFADPGYMTFSRRLANNAKSLSATGFNGVMSDQTQRAYFPTGLPDTVIGEFLFDTEIDTESYFDEYFEKAFGKDWRTAKEYLETVSSLFDIDALELRLDVTAQDTGSVDKCAKKSGIFGNEPLGDVIATVPEVIEKYVPEIKKNLSCDDKCHRESWRLLTYHIEYCKGLSKIYFAFSRDDRDLATEYCDELMGYLEGVEMEIHPYFDLFLCNQRLRQMIKKRVYFN